MLPSGVVVIWQWCRLTNLLSICTSLSTVRPMTRRPILSGRSSTCSPPCATMMRASTSSDETARASGPGGAMPARMRLVRAANSTHCSSSIAAFSSVIVTAGCPDENAIMSEVSQIVLTRRGTPPE